MGGEEGLRFRKSPELAAYSAAYSPEKVRVQKQNQKVRVPSNNPFHRNLFSRRFRPTDHCQRLSNVYPARLQKTSTLNVIQRNHRLILNFISSYSPTQQSVVRCYALATFNKTRYNSHLNFLRKCLKSQLTPKGLTVAPRCNVQRDLIRRVDKASLSFSKQLTRVCIENYSRGFERENFKLQEAKNSLVSELNTEQAREVKRKVHQLNKDVYNEYEKIKEKKYEELKSASKPVELQPNKKKVVSIPSDLPLSEKEFDVLSKGLSFIPVQNKTNIQQTKIDLEKFYRRIKLHAYFNNPNKHIFNFDDEEEESLFRKYKKNNSTWTPHETYPTISSFISRCEDDISRLKVPKPVSNLTNNEVEAIRSLRERDDIVIKKADKGGAVVVWDKELYIREGLRQLADENFYKQLDSNDTDQNNNKVKQVVEEEIAEGNLPPEAKVLVKDTPRCSRFYLLPKIHKVNNPGRPIVSAVNCPTETISAFINDILQPIVNRLPSFCKDTNDALLKIKACHDSYTHLFTMDVKSLYTVIPHVEGLSALRYFLDERSVKEPPTNTILRLAELVLSLNTFEFDDKYFSQVRGVAMGTKMGPNYANLFLGYVEKQFFETYQGPKPDLYLRYIDDILGLSTMSLNDLKKFITTFDEYNPFIKFTHEISNKTNFLDISLAIEESGISTSIFYKPTDSHSYLNYFSNHPRSCKDSIPFSQFLRLKRLCSKDSDFEIKSEEMVKFFLSEDYPCSIVTSALRKVKSISREQALQSKNNRSSDKIPLILTYNSYNRKVLSAVKRNFRIYAMYLSQPQIQ